MVNTQHFIARLALFGTILALMVVALGAYTRLTHAGLGCPDWPGCYGQISVPKTAAQMSEAQKLFPSQPVVAQKAWTEMAHRYIAGTLGMIILILSVLILRDPVLRKKAWFLVIFLSLLVCAQAALGRWTVTWRLLPMVVLAHLLGGLLLLSGLWLLYLKIRTKPFNPLTMGNDPRFKAWALLALLIVFLQIMLGGWTSTNYAALSCADFPKCNGQWFPDLHFKEAFQLLTPIGINYEGGVLAQSARTTIHWLHRVGATITFLYVGILALRIAVTARARLLRHIAKGILFLLCLQISLGILNVLWLLPLPIALAHNMVAALLLLSVLTLNDCLFSRSKA